MHHELQLETGEQFFVKHEDGQSESKFTLERLDEENEVAHFSVQTYQQNKLVKVRHVTLNASKLVSSSSSSDFNF